MNFHTKAFTFLLLLGLASLASAHGSLPSATPTAKTLHSRTPFDACHLSITRTVPFTVILVGDFNASAGLNAAYDTLTEDGGFTDTLLSAAKSINADWNTMNNFRLTQKGTRRIDWVLAKGPVKTSEAAIVLYDGSKQYPSDHQPVTAVITLE